MGDTPALDLNASLVLKQSEIEAIITAELNRRGHRIEKVSINGSSNINTGEVMVTASINIKL